MNKDQLIVKGIAAIFLLSSMYIGFKFLEYAEENQLSTGNIIFFLSFQFLTLSLGVKYFLGALKDYQ